MIDNSVTQQLIILDAEQCKFSPGQIVSTQGALAAMEEHDILPSSLLRRHLEGDWGSVPPEDADLNNISIRYDQRCKLIGGGSLDTDEETPSAGRVLSSYDIAPSVRIWIITEWDRSVTTFLLPSEY